jgi:dTDP-4-dehydrorhamnose reductase
LSQANKIVVIRKGKELKIVILGASGMLGSMILDYFARDPSIKLVATVRNDLLVRQIQYEAPNVEWRIFDAEKCGTSDISDLLDDANWVINAIGIIKPYINDENASQIKRAIAVNSLFPHLLAFSAEQNNCRIVQIATDCVFSGNKGSYIETDKHDALDVYGKTKSLGEVYSKNVFNLRCSIIGPEMKTHSSLMDWLLHQPANSSVNGYTNHKWNGITTYHYARICLGIIKYEISLPHIQHVVPGDIISKFDLLQCFAQEFNRKDISITPMEAKINVDRTLLTLNQKWNQEIWNAAGYNVPPTITRMIAELSQFKRSIAMNIG